jgi:hypothetical protein
MAYDQAGSALKMTLTAGEDLSTFQYCFVKITANNTVQATDVQGDRPIGVLQNKPGNGEAATVLLAGVTLLKSSGTINVGTNVGPENAGTARAQTVTAPATSVACGIALEAGVANQFLTAAVNCLSSQAGS